VPVAKKFYSKKDLSELSQLYIVGKNAAGQFATGQTFRNPDGVLTDKFRPNNYVTSLDEISGITQTSVTIAGDTLVTPSDNALRHNASTDSFSIRQNTPLFPGYPISKLTDSAGTISGATPTEEPIPGYYYLASGVTLTFPVGASNTHKERPHGSVTAPTTLATKFEIENNGGTAVVDTVGDIESSRTVSNVNLLFKDIPEYADPHIQTFDGKAIKPGFGLEGVHFAQKYGVVHPNKPFDARTGAKLRVYARSKNVLRIKSGMAGLAYAN
jgi:hypothetical protein